MELLACVKASNIVTEAWTLNHITGNRTIIEKGNALLTFKSWHGAIGINSATDNNS